jgi:hypothetical protein
LIVRIKRAGDFKMAGWGGSRKGAGRKPNPDKGRTVAVPKLPHNKPGAVAAEVVTKVDRAAESMWMQAAPILAELSERYSQNKRTRSPDNNPFKLPWFPPNAIPPESSGKRMAMDEAFQANSAGWLNGSILAGVGGEGLAFLGYTYLAELAQRPEYRVISETIADDMTRKWITFDVTGDEKAQAEKQKKDPAGFEESMADPDEKKKRIKAAGKTDKVKAIEDDQQRMEMQGKFYDLCRMDGFFGRAHLFLDFGEVDMGDPELSTPIGNGRDKTSRSKVGRKKPLIGLRAIEPVWTYPLAYNANNPLRADWYNPQVWYVMGQQIHGSRIPCLVGHPVPDMLKPAYAFGGLSMTQMAQPYVDIWLTTRQSIALMIKSFSVMVLKTDLQTLVQPNNAANLLARVAMWNMFRDNQGAFVLNNKTEDFANVSAPLSGLDKLQAQSQEHMASVSRIPLVKLTGISPSGLNATSDNEIEVYDDTIMARQHQLLTPKAETVVNFQQLSLFGEIDPDISWRWAPLRDMTLAEKGQKQKDDADRDVKYVDAGVLAPKEVRKRIVDDPDMPYADIDPDDVPELLIEEEEGLEPQGGRPQPVADPGAEGGESDKGGE